MTDLSPKLIACEFGMYHIQLFCFPEFITDGELKFQGNSLAVVLISLGIRA